jgi:hypothetical protein
MGIDLLESSQISIRIGAVRKNALPVCSELEEFTKAGEEAGKEHASKRTCALRLESPHSESLWDAGL